MVFYISKYLDETLFLRVCHKVILNVSLEAVMHSYHWGSESMLQFYFIFCTCKLLCCMIKPTLRSKSCECCRPFTGLYHFTCTCFLLHILHLFPLLLVFCVIYLIFGFHSVNADFFNMWMLFFIELLSQISTVLTFY